MSKLRPIPSSIPQGQEESHVLVSLCREPVSNKMARENLKSGLTNAEIKWGLIRAQRKGCKGARD